MTYETNRLKKVELKGCGFTEAKHRSRRTKYLWRKNEVPGTESETPGHRWNPQICNLSRHGGEVGDEERWRE